MTASPPIADASPIETIYPDMHGKVAVVSGAARGVGAAIVSSLRQQGVNVVGADIDDEALHSPAPGASSDQQNAAGQFRGAYLDVADPELHKTVAAFAVESFGRLDYWVNNVGIFPESPVMGITSGELTTTFNINVASVLYGSQAAVPHMKPGSAIVNISSGAAAKARRGRASYGTSKAAVTRLTRSLALELSDLGVRVNSVAPGFVDTTMTSWIQGDAEALQPVLAAIPLHRFAAPGEIAAAVLFLLSESARYITGTEIAVDGGASA